WRGPAIAVRGDLGDPAAAGRAVDAAVQGLGGLELLIVNHGIWPSDEVPVAAMTDLQWEATRRANLDSVLYVCRAAIPLLPDGGKIVLVSSTAGQRGEAFHADYAATKGAVISFTKSLAVELAPRQINVNCVAPGWVDTEMSLRPYERDGGGGRREIERTIPLGRVASPEDCAGPIRDNLLGVENHDFDLTTAAPPAEVRRLFKRTVPVGIEHGTVAVLDQQNRQHEVTTFRKDIKTDGRHAVVEFGVSLMDDLARRDFTINAIAYHPIRHEWRDPFHGAEDLEHKLIRSVGDANWRFQEDYLRILRALRFSARFEFRIHPRTLEAAKANVQGLAQLSAERVRDEWFKGIATAQRVSKLLALWIDTGAARIWLPE